MSGNPRRSSGSRNDQLEILAKRWSPPGARLDLDLIVHDHHKQVVWVLDAKNADPSNRQLALMRAQIRLLKKHPDLTNACPTITGVIVHHRRRLATTPQPTEHKDILRATLQGLPDLLLAKRLPGERSRRLTS